MVDADKALALTEAPEDAPAGWAVRSVGEADWALERIARARLELAELDAQYEAAVRRLAERRDALRREPARTVAFFEGHLRLWAEGQKDTICSGRKKSRAFLSGRIGWRARPLRLVVQDASALEAWATQQGLTRAEVDMSQVREHSRRTGEVPPGCDTEGGEDAFFVAVGED